MSHKISVHGFVTLHDGMVMPAHAVVDLSEYLDDTREEMQELVKHDLLASVVDAVTINSPGSLVEQWLGYCREKGR